MSRARVSVDVPAGAVRVADDGSTLAAVGVGSCVVVALWDREARVGGMAHPLLPRPTQPSAGEEGRFATTAVPWLIEMMERLGADRARIRARLAGGAGILAVLSDPGAPNVGARNVAAMRMALLSAGVPILAEETGGERARSVYLDTTTGNLRVITSGGGDVVL